MTINHKQTVEHFNLIFENSKNSKLELRSDKELDAAINMIATQFNISQIQSILLAVIFMFTMDDVDICTERIISFFGLKLPDFFTIKSDIEELIQIGLIKYKRENHSKNTYNSTFTINQKVLDAIFNNKDINSALIEPDMSFVQFCGWIKRVIRNRSVSDFSMFELSEKVNDIERRNPNILQIQQLKELKVNEEERMILYYLIESVTDNEPTVNLRLIIIELFGIDNYISISSQFMQNEQDLQLKGLVKVNANGYVNGYFDDATIGLTEKAYDLLLADSKVLYKNSPKTDHTIIRHESIIEKELFFNEKQGKEIDFFKESIKEENLDKLKSKLKQAGIQKSMIAIFEGVPGSGKTEVARQIAKSLQYDLFILDFTKMKSEYYSQSQKLVKEAFEEFRRVADANQNRMILLLNEADGLLHHRTNSETNHSTDETENQIQNILLEEFEKGDYLIILTTNLLNNIDKAFLRRFLFKISFDYPDKSTMKKIYRSKLGWLSDKQLDELSHIQLSGGEIDNVTVKVLMHEVFHNEKPSTYQLIDFCLQEKVEKRRLPKLGFN
ncbi:MAG: ATP-binding protein [Paludibacter sp.]|nr:ATP-binding protein [Paludibacter sp.]